MTFDELKGVLLTGLTVGGLGAGAAYAYSDKRTRARNAILAGLTAGGVSSLAYHNRGAIFDGMGWTHRPDWSSPWFSAAVGSGVGGMLGGGVSYLASDSDVRTRNTLLGASAGGLAGGAAGYAAPSVYNALF